jgi:hypothetical protein
MPRVTCSTSKTGAWKYIFKQYIIVYLELKRLELDLILIHIGNESGHDLSRIYIFSFRTLTVEKLKSACLVVCFLVLFLFFPKD